MNTSSPTLNGSTGNPLIGVERTQVNAVPEFDSTEDMVIPFVLLTDFNNSFEKPWQYHDLLVLHRLQSCHLLKSHLQ